MAVTADSVVVEVIAKTDGYTAAVNGAATATTSSMSKIEQAASKAEAAVQTGADKMGASFKRAANDVDASASRIANGQRNLGRQISDVGTQLAGGQSPFLIFAQQAPQVADALADTGGKAAQLASFFAGPWGAALLAAGSALGILIPKLFEAGQGADALVQKLQDQSIKARLAADAQAIFQKSLYGAADASAELNKRLAEQNRSQIQVAQSALAAAVALRQQNLQNLRAETAKAELAQSAARANANPLNFVGGSAAGLSAAAQSAAQARSTRDLAAANDRLKVARRGVADAEKAVVEASVPILKLQGAEQADASTAATGRHTRAVDALTAAYRKAQAAAAKLGGAAGNSARAQAAATFRAGVTTADRTLESDQKGIQGTKRNANALDSAQRTLAGLRTIEGQATGAERTNVQKRIAAVEKRIGYLKQGIDPTAASVGTGGRGKSAEQLAREAEAARVRGVRNNEAYETQTEQYNQQIIAAKRQQVVDVDQLAKIDRDAVASELKKQLAQIDADESARKYSAQQADDLRALARSAADAKNATINLALTQKLSEQQLAAAESDLGDQRDLVQASAGLAETNDQRRDVALRLLDLAEQQERLELQAVLASSKATEAQKQIAQKRLDSLGAIYGAQREGVGRQFEGAGARYQRDIATVGSQLGEAVDGIAVDGLQRLNDQLADAITGAKSLGDVFHNIAGQIVADLLRIAIQQTLIKPLASALFGGGGGGAGGLLSGLAGLLGGGGGGGLAASVSAGSSHALDFLSTTPGFATGGSMTLGGRGGIDQNLLSLNGKPLARVSAGETLNIAPNAKAASGGKGGLTVFAPQQFDLRGVMMTEKVLQQIDARNRDYANQAAAAAGREAVRAAPAAVARTQRFGTTI